MKLFFNQKITIKLFSTILYLFGMWIAAYSEYQVYFVLTMVSKVLEVLVPCQTSDKITPLYCTSHNKFA